MIEIRERLTSTLEHYEVLTKPDRNTCESGELLEDYTFDCIFPTPEPSRIEVSPYLPRSPLEQAGFLLRQQVINYINTVSEGRLDEAVVELITEVRAHANEYTREAPLLVGNVKKSERGIVNKYNNELVINHLDWKEREGATALGSVVLNNKVLEGRQGDSEILISPAGWNGRYPDYEKTQIVFVQGRGGEDLDQLTFVLNFKVENCISLLEKMGVARADLVCSDKVQTIKKMVSEPVHLNREAEIANPRGFLSLLKGEKPNDPNLKVIERDLERHLTGEDISKLSPDCEVMLSNLASFLLQSANRLGDFKFQAEVSDRVEETIYKIAEYIRGKPSVILGTKSEGSSKSMEWGDSSLIAQNGREASWRDKYQGVIEDLRRISGCAGGGSRTIRSLGGFSFAEAGLISNLEKDQYGSLEFECPKCNRTNVRPRGRLVSRCQHCSGNTNC